MSSPFSVLSLDLWEEDPKEFSLQMGKNFENSGFCGITEHSINKKLIDEVLQIFKEFFLLSEEKKMQYFEANLGGARGYTLTLKNSGKQEDLYLKVTLSELGCL